MNKQKCIVYDKENADFPGVKSVKRSRPSTFIILQLSYDQNLTLFLFVCSFCFLNYDGEYKIVNLQVVGVKTKKLRQGQEDPLELLQEKR